MSERRLHCYRRERPRRGDARAIEVFDAALELVSACFQLAERLTGADRCAVESIRWSARRFMRAARGKARRKR